MGRLLPSCGSCYVNRACRHDIFQAETYRLISVVGILSSDCDYSIPPFMNHIITGDERNVKNLETQVYVSWGMSFKDGQISSQKVNLKHTLLSADNATYAIRQPSERRI